MSEDTLLTCFVAEGLIRREREDPARLILDGDRAVQYLSDRVGKIEQVGVGGRRAVPVVAGFEDLVDQRRALQPACILDHSEECDVGVGHRLLDEAVEVQGLFDDQRYRTCRAVFSYRRCDIGRTCETCAEYDGARTVLGSFGPFVQGHAADSAGAVDGVATAEERHSPVCRRCRRSILP